MPSVVQVCNLKCSLEAEADLHVDLTNKIRDDRFCFVWSLDAQGEEEFEEQKEEGTEQARRADLAVAILAEARERGRERGREGGALQRAPPPLARRAVATAPRGGFFLRGADFGPGALFWLSITPPLTY